MRLIHTLPLAAGLALAACGGSDTVDDPANNPEDVADAMASLPNPEPGEYQMTGELVEFEVPGMSAEETQMIEGMMSAVFSEPQTQCLTAEQAAEGYQRFISEMGQSDDDCEMESFETSGNGFTARMACADDTGNSGTMTYAGEVTGDSMDMTMTVDGSDPTMGDMHMVVRMNSQRVGECTAG
jgi:hypothetical protein